MRSGKIKKEKLYYDQVSTNAAVETLGRILEQLLKQNE